MNNWFKKQLWKILIVLGFVGLLGVQIINPPIPEHARIKVPIEDIIGNIERNGVVRYAYKTYEMPFASNEIARTKHSRTFKIGEREENGEKIEIRRIDIISGVPQYYEEEGVWYQADYATTTKEYFDRQTKKSAISRLFNKAFAVTTTFFPDPHPETDTIDVTLRVTGADLSWTEILDVAVASSIFETDANNAIVRAVSSLTTNKFQQLGRSSFGFNTSPIGEGTITSSTLSLFGSAKDNALFAPVLAVVSGPNLTNTVAGSDYEKSNWGTTDFATRVSYASWDTAGYNDMPLNASGISHINKTGITNFGTRLGRDIDNSDPSSGTNINAASISSRMAETADTNQDPMLSVTYSVPVTRRIINVH